MTKLRQKLPLVLEDDLLEAALIFRDKQIEVMEEHPVENGLFGMAGAVDSCRGRNEESRNEPGS